MAVDSYMSEIQIFAFPFAPRYWAQCNGQQMSIAQNQALFSLLGTTFGGNGTTTFNLPDLRGRTPISSGNAPSGANYTLGQMAGEENHTLLMTEMPAHSHTMLASTNNADQPAPNGNLLAAGGTAALYSAGQTSTPMAANMIANAGNSQGHPNIQPYLALNFCICLQGIFPSRN
ncbi:phage tail protein [Ferruginibacter sp.]